jgi:hypothetical protein
MLRKLAIPPDVAAIMTAMVRLRPKLHKDIKLEHAQKNEGRKTRGRPKKAKELLSEP